MNNNDNVVYLNAITGKNVDIYLCDKLITDMILSYSITEGGVPEKISSFGSSVMQHFALPPSFAEIHLNFYHSAENDDRINRILYERIFDITQSIRTEKGIKWVLRNFLQYAANYNSGKPEYYNIFSNHFAHVIAFNCPDDIAELDKQATKTNLASYNSRPDVISNIAINNITSVFMGYTLKYYNLCMSNLPSALPDKFLTDDYAKHWFFTSIYSLLNLYVATSLGRRISVGNPDEDFDDGIVKADFEKYIAIVPYGMYQTGTRNDSQPINKTKVLYSIGRFDDDDYDIRHGRFAAPAQNPDQINDMNKFSSMTWSLYLESRTKDNVIQKSDIAHETYLFLTFAKHLESKITNGAASGNPYEFVEKNVKNTGTNYHITHVSTRDTMKSISVNAENNSISMTKEYGEFSSAKEVKNSSENLLLQVLEGEDGVRSLVANYNTTPEIAKSLCSGAGDVSNAGSFIVYSEDTYSVIIYNPGMVVKDDDKKIYGDYLFSTSNKPTVKEKKITIPSSDIYGMNNMISVDVYKNAVKISDFINIVHNTNQNGLMISLKNNIKDDLSNDEIAQFNLSIGDKNSVLSSLSSKGSYLWTPADKNATPPTWEPLEIKNDIPSTKPKSEYVEATDPDDIRLLKLVGYTDDKFLFKKSINITEELKKIRKNIPVYVVYIDNKRYTLLNIFYTK